MKGFLPWAFKKDKILIYSIRFLFTSESLCFYLFKTSSGKVKLQLEKVKKGKVLFTGIFKEDINRRNYSVNIIITKSLTQITLLKGKNAESFQLHLNPDFDLGLLYEPDLEFNNKAIIKMTYK